MARTVLVERIAEKRACFLTGLQDLGAFVSQLDDSGAVLTVVHLKTNPSCLGRNPPGNCHLHGGLSACGVQQRFASEPNLDRRFPYLRRCHYLTLLVGKIGADLKLEIGPTIFQ